MLAMLKRRLGRTLAALFSPCAQPQIAYNSCRNRHCPKCQASAAKRWLEARQADLLPVEYYHVVFTLPAPISAIAYTNKELIYGLLFDIAAETLRTIAADPKHLGARIGTDPGAAYLGLGPDPSSTRTRHRARRRPRARCRALGAVQAGVLPLGPGTVASLSASLPRRTQNAHRDGQLKFFGEHVDLADTAAFADWLTPLRQCEWVVYAKRPFSGPEQVLAYLSRYTHRVAISNSRLVALDDRGVTFRWKDYRAHGRRATKP